METIPLTNISVWLIAKAFVLLALSIYILFAVVVVKQVSLMTETLEVGFETPIRILSYLHLVFAVLVFALAFLIL